MIDTNTLAPTDKWLAVMGDLDEVCTAARTYAITGNAEDGENVEAVAQAIAAKWLAAPSGPARVQLTDEQIQEIISKLDPLFLDTPQGFETDFARAVLAKWGAPAPLGQSFAVPAGMEPVATVLFSSTGWRTLVDALASLEDGATLYTAPQVQAMLTKGLAPGWQAVPVEPTDAMERAMAAQFCGTVDEVRRAWAESLAAAPQPAPSGPAREPLLARARAEWHEDDGPVAWWATTCCGWAYEPAWIGTPLDSDWPGYHTHWTPHPEVPRVHGITAAQKEDQP